MILFTNLTQREIDTAALQQLGARVLSEEGVGMDEEVNCIFTDNDRIRELNARFRARDIPTDVLAFSFAEGEGAAFRKMLLGDIYISVEMAEENARTYEKELKHEIALLLVHGLLHLLGYDDESEGERKVMRAKEQRYLG